MRTLRLRPRGVEFVAEEGFLRLRPDAPEILSGLEERLAHLQATTVVATLRDSQHYVRSAELGIGIHEMRPYLVADDLAQWQPLMDWIESAATADLPQDAAPDSQALEESRSDLQGSSAPR